jgi:protein AFG1
VRFLSSGGESSMMARYDSLVQEGKVRTDLHQLQALEVLERLRKDLMTTEPSTSTSRRKTTESPATSSSSLFGGLFGNSPSWMSETTEPTPAKTRKAPKGVYLHGGVGCGKTFLMNLFYDSITTGPWAKEKQKIHFNRFMLRVHREMHQARYDSNGKANHNSDDIVPAVIKSTLAHGRLLCFDEFQVTDVADALILQRLFTGLWEHGCVVVATSNRRPDDLYLNGLQRSRFLPFIDVLKRKCQILSMEESDTDYRLIQKQLSGTSKLYFVGGKPARKEFDALFYEFAGPGTSIAPTSLRTQGRKVPIPQAALSKGLARFTFEDLCQKALGAADYLVIGQYFHTVFLEKIPVLTLNEINWVRRLITFVDCMYECNVKLIVHANTPVAEIFQPGTEQQDHDEVFAFARTVSRLEEMKSQSYLQKPWIGNDKDHENKVDLHTFSLEPSLGDVASGI